MKHGWLVCASLLLAPSAFAAHHAAAKTSAAPAVPATPDHEIVAHGRFKEVHIYTPQGEPKSAVLFLSGDGGWNAGVVDMAKSLVAQGALVAGVSTPDFLKALEPALDPCVYPDGDLENLSHFVQAFAKMREYRQPVIVGYSSGASLAYAALAQAPAGTFAGALVLGFCPELILHKPMCPADGLRSTPKADGKGTDLLPSPRVGSGISVLQGEIDQVCVADVTREFMGQIPGAQLVLLPKVGHGYSVERNWMPQFLAEFHRLTAPAADAPPPPPPAIADLPVVEVPSATEGGDTFAVIVSGDGGWAGLDRNVARTLSERGIPVVGIDSLRYFWTARDPDGFGADLARLIRFYLAQWKRESVYLIGYSQGGDVLPFGVNRLPADLRARVKLIAPLAPAEKAAFEFHLTNWVGGHGDIPLMPEMEKLEHDPALVCIWGRDEGGSICPKLDAAKFRVIGLPGAHHFNGDYKTVAETLLKSAVK